MKNHLTIIFIVFFITQISYSQNQQIPIYLKDKIIPIESKSPNNIIYNDLEFLKPLVGDKTIVILGEAGHGDGATFSMKARLIKYLVEKQGFNTIAFEGGDLWGMNEATIKILNKEDPYLEFRKAWFAIWSASEQTQKLISFLAEKINQNKLNLLGLDNQPFNHYSYRLLKAIKEYLNSQNLKTFDDEDWVSMEKTYYSICRMDTTYATNERIKPFQKKINILIDHLNTIDNEEKDIFIRSLKNLQSFNEMSLIGFKDYESQNKGINIRDEEMFNTLDWYIEKNKDAKIIVWTANFHGAHDLNKIIYTPDKTLYQKLKVFGEYVNNKYKNDAYSIAFTSSEGYTGTIYQKDSLKIEQSNKDFEKYLSQTNYEYAFMDFSEIRNNNICRDLKFNSRILGYHSHYGQWFFVFDGLIYIRKMTKSIPISIKN